MNFKTSFKFLLLINFLYKNLKATQIINDNNNSNNISNNNNNTISNGINDNNILIFKNKISSINNNNNNNYSILEAVNVTTIFLNTNNNKIFNENQLIQKNYKYNNNHSNNNEISNLTEIKNNNKNKNIKLFTEIPHKIQIINDNYEDNYNNDKYSENVSRKFKRKYKISKKPTILDVALQSAAKQGLEAMNELYNKLYPAILYRKQYLHPNHPAALLSKFSEQYANSEYNEKAAFATLEATKSFQKSYKRQTEELGRQATTTKISFRRTALEGLCPPREQPICLPAAQRYRTHDGTCNNQRRLRWGSAQMPFNRFLPPDYGDGVDSIRSSADGGALSSARFISLLVHGAREGDAPVTLMLAQWGQLIDHDLTSTAQPRSINGSVPRCCGPNDFHPSCFPIKVPLDDPWLAPLKVRCLEFLRSAPAQRRDCVLSWREQSNQATSYVDASPIYSSNARTSDNARIFQNGLLVFGRGNPTDDLCHRGALGNQCIRTGDPRSGEQPGLLALHHVWVTEHNRIASQLSDLNSHWSDEKVYQETRRIIGALFQHITYREFLPLVLGREVCRLFDLDLLNSGYYNGYDPHINPTVANSFAAAAFRFGHSLIQGSYMRCDFNHNFISNNVTLHEEFSRGDIGTSGSLHRLIRGMVAQRALKRDEFITPELTNHLFQSGNFPFGLDLAAINIQRGRDHGIPPYTQWREPCGLSPISSWEELIKIVGPESTNRIRHAYSSVHDIDLFVGGIAERPVVGGLVGPTFACIIAQQFSNLRKGDRFWYENPGFESSFTPAQLHSIRHVSLAQILCRVLGGGTLQPHVFIPNEADGNERIACGKGLLAAIDLLPWQEQDPFNTAFINLPENKQNLDLQPTVIKNSTNLIIENKHDELNGLTINKIDFIIPNGSTGIHRPDSKVHDKLDFISRFKPQHNKPLQVDNKLANDLKRTSTVPTKRTTKRTVIINNIPIELGRTANPTLSTTTIIGIKNITLTEKTNKTLGNLKNINNDPLTETATTKIFTLTNTTQATSMNKTTRQNRIGKLSRNFIKLKSTNNTSSKNITVDNFLKITTKNPQAKYRTTPSELRNYYDMDTVYRPPQKIVTRPTENTDNTANNSPQYEIEINIRQTNKVNTNNRNYLNRPPSMSVDYTGQSTDFNNNYQTIPPRRSDTNFYPPPVRSPFSHTRPATESKPNYEIPNSLPSGPLTKPPKIIYLNDNDDFYNNRPTTTIRPNFFQSIFGTFSGVNTQFDRTSGQTNNDGFYITSTKQEDGLVNGVVHGTANEFGTSLTLNIKPGSKPFSNVDGYPSDIQTNKRPQNNYHQYGLLKPHTPQITNTGEFINTQYYDTKGGNYKTTSTRRPFYNRPDIYNDYPNELRNYYPEHKLLETILETNQSQNDTTNLTNITDPIPNDKITTTDLTTNLTANIDYYDYETDDDDDNESMDKKFDKDGYLRPEHMALDFLETNNNKQTNIQLNKTKSVTVDDDFVMPALIRQRQIPDKTTNTINMTILHNNETLPRRTLNDDILADDYDEKTTQKPIVLLNISKIKTEKIMKIPIATHPTVPINVLTKPERPDKWIIYNPALPEKPPLPEIPELNMESSFTTEEFPKPITQKKFNMTKIMLQATEN